MSKLKRDVHAWAIRMRMSRMRIWGVVEGVKHDVPFYESLLVEGAGIQRVEFVHASDIEVDGVSAGGKSHALRLFRILSENDNLIHLNRETRVDVLFFLDRDDDYYLGVQQEQSHLHYTRTADVEAEIFANADLPVAVSGTFSISRTVAAAHTPSDPASELATIWAEWIALRLASGECGWSNVRFAQSSTVNVPLYGSVDEARVQSICETASEARPGWHDALTRARDHVNLRCSHGEAGELVKGKWLPPYLIERISRRLHVEHHLPKVHSAQLITACLMSIDFRALWLDQYASQLQPVLDA